MRRLILAAALLAGACMTSAAQPQATSADQAPPARASGMPQLPPGTPPPYLTPATWPDSLALLPPPPAPGSSAFARDEAARTDAERLRGTARWDRAASDADLHFPHAADTFSCAANIPISQERTPRLYALLGRSFIDVALSTYRAKTHYQRTRPFVAHNAATCTPADEAMLRNDGSYPSGHSAAGWGWALILAEIAPNRANEILQRGRDFGQSRIVCGVHWQSDVDAGRVIASATIARLHADPAFQADLAAAKAEVDSLREAQARPDANSCAAEAASLRSE